MERVEGQRQAGIEITPQMIEAGKNAFVYATATSEPSDVIEELVCDVFLAMLRCAKDVPAPLYEGMSVMLNRPNAEVWHRRGWNDSWRLIPRRGDD